MFLLGPLLSISIFLDNLLQLFMFSDTQTNQSSLLFSLLFANFLFSISKI